MGIFIHFHCILIVLNYIQTTQQLLIFLLLIPLDLALRLYKLFIYLLSRGECHQTISHEAVDRHVACGCQLERVRHSVLVGVSRGSARGPLWIMLCLFNLIRHLLYRLELWQYRDVGKLNCNRPPVVHTVTDTQISSENTKLCLVVEYKMWKTHMLMKNVFLKCTIQVVLDLSICQT